MSYHEGTYIPLGHKTHAQIWDLSDQLYRSKRDCLAINFVLMLPNAIFLEKRNIKVNEVHDIWKSWNVEKQKAFLALYEDIALLLPIQVDEQLIKAIMPFWDPSYRCFTFYQEYMVPTVEEYIVLLQIEISNPNKVFWNKTKGVRFVKKMS